jgi:hypothetical protein
MAHGITTGPSEQVSSASLLGILQAMYEPVCIEPGIVTSASPAVHWLRQTDSAWRPTLDRRPSFQGCGAGQAVRVVWGLLSGTE